MAKHFWRNNDQREKNYISSEMHKSKYFVKSADGVKNETLFMSPARAVVFKDIIWLLSQSTEHRYMFLADLEWAIMPPFLLEQFCVFYKNKMPVACVCWAKINDNMIEHIKNIGARIGPQDWNSGDNIVIMGVVAPFGGAVQVLEEVKKKIFPGQAIHMMQSL